jgi:hypothetical protein
MYEALLFAWWFAVVIGALLTGALIWLIYDNFRGK